MNPTNGTHQLSVPNPLGTPTRMILLGYYDGPTEGVMQFGADGAVYLFTMPDEEHQLSQQSFPREYAFQPLRSDALDRLEAVLAQHLVPSRPAWYVNWQFKTNEVEREVEQRVAAILAEAGPTEWLVTVPECWAFEDFHPTRYTVPQPV